MCKNHNNVDQDTYLNEYPSINIPVAESQQQQVNDNYINSDQITYFNEHLSNNRPVIYLPIQQVNDN